ncbi:MAG: hypothetical protein GC159_21440 [Phycisphaera sp.]|nr:hypothetical protein [Phycisphaera sp.]
MNASEIFTELTHRGYVQHAFVAALAVGLVCSLLSVLVVLKRMAFVGHGISHAGFGGVGTAILLGFGNISVYYWQQNLIVLAFCLGSALFIGLMTRSRRVESDTAIGILLTASMAWGILAQNLRVAWMDQIDGWPAYREWVGPATYTPKWETVLFGSLFNVGEQGMWTALIMMVIVLGTCAALFKELTFFAFDTTVSRVFGVPTTVLHYLLMVLLALVIVVSIQLVGLILVSAMLIVPGAAALLMSQRMSRVLTVAGLIGLGGSAAGLLISLAVGTLSPGACIVAVLCAVFIAAYLYDKLIKRSATRA